MITLDEAILHAEKEAEKSENIVNTGTFEDGWTVAEMYCDDTECIEAHLFRCAEYAEEHRQLAEWLKDYKRLLEQEPFMNKPCVAHQVCHEDKAKVLDKIRAEIEKEYLAEGHPLGYWDGIDKCLQIIDKYRTESEE